MPAPPLNTDTQRRNILFPPMSFAEAPSGRVGGWVCTRGSRAKLDSETGSSQVTQADLYFEDLATE